jgi:hypothetical protein
MCYKKNLRSTLLSMLIPIRYTKTIETIEDLDKSGLPFIIPGKTAPHMFVATDPRPAMQRIFKRSIVYPFTGTPATWATDM